MLIKPYEFLPNQKTIEIESNLNKHIRFIGACLLYYYIFSRLEKQGESTACLACVENDIEGVGPAGHAVRVARHDEGVRAHGNCVSFLFDAPVS